MQEHNLKKSVPPYEEKTKQGPLWLDDIILIKVTDIRRLKAT